MTIDDGDLPKPAMTKRSPLLWWFLLAAAVVAVSFFVWRPEPRRSSPAEHDTAPVARQGVDPATSASPTR